MSDRKQSLVTGQNDTKTRKEHAGMQLVCMTFEICLVVIKLQTGPEFPFVTDGRSPDLQEALNWVGGSGIV